MIGIEIEQLKAAIESAKNQYNQLVLVGGFDSERKSSCLAAVAAEYGSGVVNLNLEIAKQLLELTPKKRILRLPSLLQEIVEKNTSPVFLDHAEILFDSSLQQDPLRLLQIVSRNKCVVFSWSGTIDEKNITYAEQTHAEFRTYNTHGNIFVPIHREINTQLQNL